MSEATARLEAKRLETPPAPAGFSFFKQAISVLVFTLAVILFGAVVRITGSGAGCGQHWPTCQGEILHLPRQVATVIELTHRITSGLSALLVFWLTFRAFRRFAPRSPVRRAMATASAFMIVEALIGAALVLLNLVGSDASSARATVMSLHLVSTSALTASLGLAAWWSQPAASAPATRSQGLRALPTFALFLLVAVSATGAVTALGDTVYPVRAGEVAARLAELESPTAHFLERLRVVHPLLALATAVVLLALASRAIDPRHSRAARAFAKAVVALTLVQVALGGVNVLLSAPGWLQVAHLLVATLLWLALVLLTTELWAPRTAA